MPVDAPESTPLNPYAPPKASVGDVISSPTSQPALFPVGCTKLAVMSIVTFGLYQIYWFYQNWKAVQRLNSEELNAPVRALFFTVTAYFLFKRIEKHVEPLKVNINNQAGPLALAVFVLTIGQRLPDPFWLVSLLAFLPLLPVQAAANELNRKVASDADPNERYTGWNIAGLVIGGTLLLAAIVGIFIGDT